MADALLSDIDGTLVDNNALHAEACRQIGKGGDQVAKASQPEADSFAAALEKVMMRAEQAVALADTPWDAQAAGKLGIPVTGLNSGDWKADDLRRVRGSLAGSRRPPAQLRPVRPASLKQGVRRFLLQSSFGSVRTY